VLWSLLVPAIALGGFLGLSALPDGAPWSAAHHTLSAEMEQIASRIGFSDEGRRIFTETDPRLLASTEFLDACADTEGSTDIKAATGTRAPREGAAESAGAPGAAEGGDGIDDGQLATIGCYYWRGPVSGQIAIFRPSDDRLADQIVVTAAHEFLHAAYDRLSTDERARLDPLLAERWAQIPSDDPIQESLASSVGSASENLATEQFAYLGSEVADLGGAPLDAFYDMYFLDRQAVVAANDALLALWNGLSADYQAKADALQAHEQANADADAQLQADRSQLESESAVYTTQVAEYNALAPQDQARLFVMNSDGTVSDEPWGRYLTRTYDDITALEGGFDGRQAELDASIAAAATERAAVELLEADLRALDAASVPAAG